MQPKLIVAFERLTENDFLTKVGTILKSLDGNPDFADSWSDRIPSLAQLRARYEEYREAFFASLSRDTYKIMRRNELRKQLSAELKQIVTHLELVAQGNIGKLQTTGFDLRRLSVRPRAGQQLPAPDDVRAQSMHGMFLLRAARLPGASAYEIQTSSAKLPISDDDWTHALTTTSVQRVFVRDLPPGYHWARLRGINSNGGGEWSRAVKVMVE